MIIAGMAASFWTFQNTNRIYAKERAASCQQTAEVFKVTDSVYDAVKGICYFVPEDGHLVVDQVYMKAYLDKLHSIN